MAAYDEYIICKCGWWHLVGMSVWHFGAGRHCCPRCGNPTPYDDFFDEERSGWRVVTARPVRVRDGFLRSHVELRERPTPKEER